MPTVPVNYDYQTQLNDAQRRRKLAEALRMQSMQPIEQTSSGAYATPISWTQGLAKVLQGVAAGKSEKKADEIEKQTSQKYQTDLNDVLTRASQAMSGQAQPVTMGQTQTMTPTQAPDVNKAASIYMQHPATQGIGQAVLTHQLSPTLGSKNSPSAVQEWQFYNQLSPTDQKRYLEMKRQMYEVGKIGEVPNLISRTPGISPVPLSTLPKEVEGKATIAGAQEAAKTNAEQVTKANFDLGSNLDDIQKMRDNISGLLASKGFNTVYGLSGKIDPRNYIPGTDASNAAARLSQLDAQSFGISIQKMRGLGQLSNAEGQKVTSAYTRATNPKISEGEAREAWSEVLHYLDLAEQRSKEKAGQPATPVHATPATRKYNPATGKIE